jgi:hypothetical protein
MFLIYIETTFLLDLIPVSVFLATLLLFIDFSLIYAELTFQLCQPKVSLQVVFPFAPDFDNFLYVPADDSLTCPH